MSSQTSNTSARKLAGWAALISVPFAIMTQVLFGLAHYGDIHVFLSGEQALALSDSQATAMYYGYWADVLGYYLIFLPVIVYAWNLFRPEHGYKADLAFLCGTIFCVMGAMGAVTQAEAYMSTREFFTSDLVGAKSAAIVTWETTISGQWRGVWMLETLLGAVWFAYMSKFFVAQRSKGIGVFSAIIALVWFIQILTWLIPGGKAVSDIALSINALVVPIWALCLGASLVRNSNASG